MLLKCCQSAVEVLSFFCRRPPAKTGIKVTQRLPCIEHLRIWLFSLHILCNPTWGGQTQDNLFTSPSHSNKFTTAHRSHLKHVTCDFCTKYHPNCDRQNNGDMNCRCLVGPEVPKPKQPQAAESIMGGSNFLGSLVDRQNAQVSTCRYKGESNTGKLVQKP